MRVKQNKKGIKIKSMISVRMTLEIAANNVTLISYFCLAHGQELLGRVQMSHKRKETSVVCRVSGWGPLQDGGGQELWDGWSGFGAAGKVASCHLSHGDVPDKANGEETPGPTRGGGGGDCKSWLAWDDLGFLRMSWRTLRGGERRGGVWRALLLLWWPELEKWLRKTDGWIILVSFFLFSVGIQRDSIQALCECLLSTSDNWMEAGRGIHEGYDNAVKVLR